MASRHSLQTHQELALPALYGSKGDPLHTPTLRFKHHNPHKKWSLLTTDFENPRTTGNNGYLGSRNDEERSEMRYVMRIAEFRESSNF